MLASFQLSSSRPDSKVSLFYSPDGNAGEAEVARGAVGIVPLWGMIRGGDLDRPEMMLMSLSSGAGSEVGQWTGEGEAGRGARQEVELTIVATSRHRAHSLTTLAPSPLADEQHRCLNSVPSPRQVSAERSDPSCTLRPRPRRRAQGRSRRAVRRLLALRELSTASSPSVRPEDLAISSPYV